MGNHDAGRAMGRAAGIALKMRNGQSALEILDMVGEPYRGCDAEFEAENPERPGYINPAYANYTDVPGPLGKLIAEAFGEPGVDYQALYKEAGPDSDFHERWYQGPYTKFKERFDLC